MVCDEEAHRGQKQGLNISLALGIINMKTWRFPEKSNFNQLNIDKYIDVQSVAADPLGPLATLGPRASWGPGPPILHPF